MFKTRYFYYYQFNLHKHFHYYKALSELGNKRDIQLELITFVKVKDYFKQKNIISFLKKANSHVFLSFQIKLTVTMYFFLMTLFNKKIIIHFKQTTPGRLILLKRVFPKKITFITDLEGDRISEQEYLMIATQGTASLSKENAGAMRELVVKEGNKLSLFDFIFVYNSHFVDLIKYRYPFLPAQIKVAHLMSFKKGNLFFSEVLRHEYRTKLSWDEKPIITYVGNIHYAWQNISKTIKIFKRIKDELNLDAKLLLLINKNDHPKALKFINKYQVIESDYCLKEVNNTEINGYLNASDLGIVLRDFHEMNKVVTSGKLLDYLGSGLPFITTSVLLNFEDNAKINEFGLILDNLNVEDIMIEKISRLLHFDNQSRRLMSNWANENLSLDQTSENYFNLLRSLSN